MREPRRSALGLLYEGWGEGALEWHDLAPIQAFTQRELSILKTMLHQTCNTPRTSSAGRLFDAISSLLNLCHHASFEGQAAMKLEWVMTPLATNEHYPFEVLEPSAPGLPAIVDWVVMLHHVLADYRSGCAPEIVSAKVHNTLVEMMVAIVQRCGVAQIVLTGGCFQNRYLTERAVQRLKEAGFCPYWHRQVPPNDGGIALGQIMAALRQ
jgi:hydrogenase maturation protein HypF